jgi:hypothetical protein
MSKEIRMDQAVVEDSPGAANDNPMPASHSALSWWAAHGADGEYLVNRHFGSGAFPFGKKTDINATLGHFIDSTEPYCFAANGAYEDSKYNNFLASFSAFILSQLVYSAVIPYNAVLLTKGYITGNLPLGQPGTESSSIAALYKLNVPGNLNSGQVKSLSPVSEL